MGLAAFDLLEVACITGIQGRGGILLEPVCAFVGHRQWLLGQLRAPYCRQATTFRFDVETSPYLQQQHLIWRLWARPTITKRGCCRAWESSARCGGLAARPQAGQVCALELQRREIALLNATARQGPGDEEDGGEERVLCHPFEKECDQIVSYQD